MDIMCTVYMVWGFFLSKTTYFNFNSVLANLKVGATEHCLWNDFKQTIKYVLMSQHRTEFFLNYSGLNPSAVVAQTLGMCGQTLRQEMYFFNNVVTTHIDI